MSKPFHDDPPFPHADRRKVARDALVFQVKLFTDGIKDILLSPLSLLAGLVGILFSRGNPGVPLYELLRLGKRFERWLGLFSAAYEHDEEPATDQKGEDSANPIDFDSLVKRLEKSLLDPETRGKLSERSKNQLDELAKKITGER
ncbi:MAG: hypothetical protein AAF465_09775 [Pseudomonadota bacterium]